MIFIINTTYKVFDLSVNAKQRIAVAPNKAEPRVQSGLIPTTAIKTESNLKPSLQVFLLLFTFL